MEDTLDELSAVVEDQVVMPGIRNPSRHCTPHRSGLVCRNRDVEIRMRRDLTAGTGMRLQIIFGMSGRSPEQSLPPMKFWIKRRVSLCVVTIDLDTDMSESSGTPRPVRNAHIICALARSRTCGCRTLLLGQLLSTNTNV